jgi:Tn7-like transposition protein D/TniQ
MMGGFADPYPDELFYSICARICKRAGYPSYYRAMQDLFGSDKMAASIAFPGYLDDFVARLPLESRYTSDYFLAEHTLLPLYHPFLPPERSRRLRLDMCGRKGPSLHNPCGMSGSPIPRPEWLRFCPECVREDKSRYGECYWHRTHQITGIEICPFHQVSLQRSDVRARNRRSRYQFVSAEDVLQWTEQQPSGTPNPSHQILLVLARDINFLLHQQHLSKEEPTRLYQRYRQLLFERGLVTYRGRVVDTSLLLQQFRNAYPRELLQLLHCEIDKQRGRPWLLHLVRVPKNAHDPLHHLLLIYFLGYTAEEFFALPVERKPFGDGPWPCLNPVCEQYHQPCITACQIVHKRGVKRPIGIFVCTCGFAYSRLGPESSANHPFQLSKIKAFGAQWETKLKTLWKDETASLQAIADQLGVAPRTVKLQAMKRGLPFPRPGGTYPDLKELKRPRRSRVQTSDPTVLETNRAAWLALMQAHPEAGVTILRNREAALHSWLERNDKTWLSAHLPCPQKPKQPASRVDWEARDLQLAEKVRGTALHLKNLPGRPVFLTVTAIGREIGHLTLLRQHLEKLPRTAEVLREFVETHEAFAVRRVWWAVTAFRQEQVYPLRWQLMLRAGVNGLAMRPEVKSALDSAMQILQRE